MKIKRYKLKDGVTKEELISLGAKEGGSWIGKSIKLFIGKFCCFKDKKQRINFEFSIDIGFKDNISDWNDFDNVIILDEDFYNLILLSTERISAKKLKTFPYLKNVLGCITSIWIAFHSWKKLEMITMKLNSDSVAKWHGSLTVAVNCRNTRYAFMLKMKKLQII